MINARNAIKARKARNFLQLSCDKFLALITVIEQKMQDISRFSHFYQIYRNFLHLSFYARNIFAMQKMCEMRYWRNEKCEKSYLSRLIAVGEKYEKCEKN